MQPQLPPMSHKKVRLSLLEGSAPLSAERSALAVVTFVFDRHRYSGEQLSNVLTAEGFLCYCDEDTRVRGVSRKRMGEDGQAVGAPNAELDTWVIEKTHR